MRIFSKIDIGKVRHSNQDSYFAVLLDDGSAFTVVCDGMGGAKAGNVASETAVKTISEYVIRSYSPQMDDSSIANMLKGAVATANIDIYDLALKNSSYNGMGTTVVTALIRKDSAVICHAGDSRAYLISDEISQITRDHSMVQSLVESGKLTAEEAKVHPRKNVITRALGAEENINSDVTVVNVSVGNVLLFCTDGLSNFVESSDMLSIFKNNDISCVPNILVDTANNNGGGDNITVVAVEV